MFTRPLISHVLLLLSFILPFASAGNSLDAVKNFCRRVAHSDQVLLSVNLTSSWQAAAIPIAQKAKHSSGGYTGYRTPPNFAYGAFFAGPAESTKIYSFGGTSSGYNTTFVNYFLPPDTTYALWSYDFETSVWTAIDTLSQGITIPSHGASAEAADQGLAFYLGGQIDNGTSSDMSTLTDPLAIPGMIAIDTTTGRVTNLTIPDSATGSRQDGAAIYIPEYGDKGVLIALGGTSNGDTLDMSQIDVFDIATLDQTEPDTNNATVNTWYTVKATGQVPNPRAKFCTVAVSSQDSSSINIYVYGGQSGSYFDDVFVLSLPSFTWTQVYSGTSPRWGMSCSFVAPRSMVIAGGIGTTNNLTKDCDWLNQGIGFLDLSAVQGSSGWTPNFDADAKPYEVPIDVIKTIGGSGQGGANKTRPSSGWPNQALENLFQIRVVQNDNGTNPIPTSTSNSTPTSHSTTTPNSTSTPQPSAQNTLSTAAKAGIAVGIVVVVLIILALTFLMWKRKQKRRTEANVLEDPTKPELQSLRDPQEVPASEKNVFQVEKDGTMVHEAPVVDSKYVGVYEAPEYGDSANPILYEVSGTHGGRKMGPERHELQ